MSSPLSGARRHPLRLVLPLIVLLLLSFGAFHVLRVSSVVLIVGGQGRRVPMKNLHTVQDVLTKSQVSLGKRDFATPVSTAPIVQDMTIRVTRVTVEFSTSTVLSPPIVQWSHRTRANLRRVLVEKGYAGKKFQKFKVLFYDGKEVSRKLVYQKNVHVPFYTLTLFNDSGFPVKKYDLMKAKTLKMLATAYYVGDPMVPGDETRLGYKLQRGLVAVDPRVIPLGTRLYIPGYGYSFASDTGSAILDMRIDLAVKDAKEETLYNHRHVTIYVLDKGRKW